MKINIICIGKLKEKYFADAQTEYIKRIQPYASIKILEFDDDNLNSDSKILKAIENTYPIALAINANMISSEELAKKIKEYQINSISSISFIIGGSDGLSKKILSKCQEKISISKLTFPHRLARIIWIEQIYRSFKIIKNEPYHK